MHNYFQRDFINFRHSLESYKIPSSDIVQFSFQPPMRCITKHLKGTKLYSIEFLRTEMTLDSSD